VQLLGDMPELADTRMLQWIGILGDNELHTVANASENEGSTTINLRERRPTDESSLQRSSILAAEELTDGVRRQDQHDSNTGSGYSRRSTSVSGVPPRKHSEMSAAFHY